MNNEIKEIIIKDFNEILVKEFCTDWKEKRLYIGLLVNSTPFSNLSNYITNLQQENERLKENNMSYQEEMARTWKITDDYKSRIEKAVEYVKECYTQPPNIENFMHEGEMNYLLNILNGKE